MSWAAARRGLAVVALMAAAATATAAPAAAAQASLTVTPREARLGDTITITGSGFELCTEPSQVALLGLADMTLIAEPAGIKLPTIPVAESFTGQGRVSPEAAEGEYTITALCPNVRSPVRSPAQAELVSAFAVLTVVVEPPDETTPTVGDQGDPGDPGGGVDTPDGTVDVAAGPVVVPPTVPSPAPGLLAAWPLLLVGLALLVLLAGVAVGRQLLLRGPMVEVRPLAGVVVGPRVRARPPAHEGVRIVPHADPGRRVLTVGPEDRRSSP